MRSYEKLLLENKAWAAEQIGRDPKYFSRLADIQTPEFLWIGCSDSRVPANEITNTQPGEIFVHRNIANLVVENDLNILSVLQYAVEVLKVKHVIVCGHYGCGGVKASMGDQDLGLINHWLKNIKDVHAAHKFELDGISDAAGRADRLAELSVEQQVRNLANTDIIRNTWNSEARPVLHGWIYGLSDGILKSLVKIERGVEVKYDMI